MLREAVPRERRGSNRAQTAALSARALAHLLFFAPRLRLPPRAPPLGGGSPPIDGGAFMPNPRSR
eukprot:673657-Prymnesium_polylepis.1